MKNSQLKRALVILLSLNWLMLLINCQTNPSTTPTTADKSAQSVNRAAQTPPSPAQITIEKRATNIDGHAATVIGNLQQPTGRIEISTVDDAGTQLFIFDATSKDKKIHIPFNATEFGKLRDTLDFAISYSGRNQDTRSVYSKLSKLENRISIGALNPDYPDQVVLIFADAKTNIWFPLTKNDAKELAKLLSSGA